MLKQRAGIAMPHINYNGSAPALTDVIAGRVPLMFDIWHSAKRYVESGDLKLIAGAGAQRLAGRAAMCRPSPRPIPASTSSLSTPWSPPPACPRRCSTSSRPTSAPSSHSPEFAEKVRNLGIFPLGNTPQELDAWMRKEIARWAELAKAANIKAE